MRTQNRVLTEYYGLLGYCTVQSHWIRWIQRHVVPLNKTTQLYIPEGSNLHTYRCENLQSHLKLLNYVTRTEIYRELRIIVSCMCNDRNEKMTNHFLSFSPCVALRHRYPQPAHFYQGLANLIHSFGEFPTLTLPMYTFKWKYVLRFYVLMAVNKFILFFWVDTIWTHR